VNDRHKSEINRPGAPTKPLQLMFTEHTPGEERSTSTNPRGLRTVLPTGEGTGNNGAADPHPSNEGHYDRIRHPRGVKRPKPRADIAGQTASKTK
jgi:hypothetical protein